MDTVHGEPDIAAVLEQSDERDRYERRILAAWRDGFAAGREAGWREGYGARQADEAAEHRVTRKLLHEAIAPTLDPGGWEREQMADAARRVRASEAAGRRDAAEHERAFVAKAWNTPPHLRTAAQRATVHAYPPPAAGRKAGAA